MTPFTVRMPSEPMVPTAPPLKSTVAPVLPVTLTVASVPEIFETATLGAARVDWVTVSVSVAVLVVPETLPLLVFVPAVKVSSVTGFHFTVTFFLVPSLIVAVTVVGMV